MRIAFLVLTGALCLGPAARAAEDAPGRLDAADTALARRLGAQDARLDAYLKALGEHVVDRTLDAGHGGRRLRLSVRGHRFSATVSVGAHRGRVTAVEIDVHAADDAWQRVGEAFLAAVGDGFERTQRGAHGAWSRPKALAAHRAEVERALGPTPEVDLDELPEDVRDAYAMLTAPTRWYPVGRSFGYAGVEPDGLVAARVLEKAGEVRLLRAALRGLNPEGRVVAALHLLELAEAGEELSDADRRAIGAIRGSDVPIDHCQGCVVHTAPAAEAFAAD
jgi:hypothetical protein